MLRMCERNGPPNFTSVGSMWTVCGRGTFGGLVEFLMDGKGFGHLDAVGRHALPKLVPCHSIPCNEIARLDQSNWITGPDTGTCVSGCEKISSRHTADHFGCQDAARTERALARPGVKTRSSAVAFARERGAISSDPRMTR
jgi:hypothetical protein